jgi:phosphohistidine phosphatase
VIYHLRHAEAEDGEGKPDAERELTEKGRRQADVAGQAMAALGIEPDACLTSPKVRAHATAVIACRHLGCEPEEVDDLSGGPFDARALADGRGDVVLVGHEPDMSNELARITGAELKLKKGGLAATEGDVLHLLLRQADLKRIARGG